MGTAADWSRISLFPRAAHEHGPTLGTFSVTNLSWTQQRATMHAAPLFGGRRSWVDYSYETTGYGSLELCGQLAYRVTIVHPDDDDARRRHHRLIRSGRSKPAWFRRQPDAGRVHVIDHAELETTRANARGSWLFMAQRIARLCGTDDEVARLAGPAVRQLLWSGREHLGSARIADAIGELQHATETLAVERTRYTAAVDRLVGDQPQVVVPARDVLHDVRRDIETIRFEARVLAEVREEWDVPTGIPSRPSRRGRAGPPAP
ncbi:MAG: hypothetical protein ABW075_04960 [Aeromicrobium sp.]